MGKSWLVGFRVDVRVTWMVKVFETSLYDGDFKLWGFSVRKIVC